MSIWIAEDKAAEDKAAEDKAAEDKAAEDKAAVGKIREATHWALFRSSCFSIRARSPKFWLVCEKTMPLGRFLNQEISRYLAAVPECVSLAGRAIIRAPNISPAETDWITHRQWPGSPVQRAWLKDAIWKRTSLNKLIH